MPHYEITKTTRPGNRVRIDCPESKYHGLAGTIIRIDPTSHATMNGGGWDVDLALDSNPWAEEDYERRAELHRSLGISAEYTLKHGDETRIRSTMLVIA